MGFSEIMKEYVIGRKRKKGQKNGKKSNLCGSERIPESEDEDGKKRHDEERLESKDNV